MMTPVVTLLLFLSVASAQFQFFEQFFQGGQQQAAPEKQNVPSDSNWYRQNWEGATCSNYLCPDTLACVHFPHHCPCPHPDVEDKVELAEGIAETLILPSSLLWSLLCVWNGNQTQVLATTVFTRLRSMDPFSLTAGAIQIAAACAQCTVTIIKWVGDVRTVDARISSFCDEVSALRATYEGLEHSLSSPLMAEAARIASKTSDGGPLWLQIREALDDSKKNMNTSGFAHRIKAQLQESLASGELFYLRQRIQVFNSSLSLPIQMVCVMLQLEQRGISVENQIALNRKLISLEKSIQELVQTLSTPSNSGSTQVASDVDSSGRAGMEAYMAFAQKFLTTASAAASTRSSLSTISQPNVPLEHRRLSGVGLSGDNKARVAGWIPPPSPPSRESRCPTDHEQRNHITQSPRLEVPNTVGAEVEFLRTKRHLDLGQERLQQDQHVAAETHFRKALALMKGHDFQGKISLQPADIVLIIADCCLKQQKFDEGN
ncbi:long chronological lifespan protein 2 [Exophiala mesophila]|uniref:Long chronological lifespan protein 2 n=1 Tax=Exophiala mesophila TaxID=212818 RepID=A0A0D1WTS6_EXOME|nr:long chronological lifespan protein 2 [Exophiala mesophila]KIV92620.1 long chronological lifespan protein 2 [Exophiala mesophila]